MTNKSLMTFKLIVSLLSLLLVLQSVDLPTIFLGLGNIKWGFVFAAMSVFWVAQVISSLRFVYIADELGKKLTLLTATNAHFVGLWFNQILPTSLGGDVLKVAFLKRVIGLGVAVRSAILDRFSGLFILMLAILITLPLYSEIIPPKQGTLLLGLEYLPITFITATLVLAWGSAKFNDRVADVPLLSQFAALVSEIWLFRKPQAFWKQLWTSTIVHLNGIAAYGLLGRALGFEVDPLIFVLIVPLVFFVGLLPISFAGWGVREAGAVWLFGLVGIPKENALILSVAYGLLLILAASPGLVMFALGKRLEHQISR